MEAYKKLAQILRTDQEIIKSLEERTGGFVGKKGILDNVVKENKELIVHRLCLLKLGTGSSLKEVAKALEKKLIQDEKKIRQLFNGADLSKKEDCEKILEFAKRAVNPVSGLFLKKEKAAEFLRKTPPQNIIKFLGYGNVKELLAKENLLEVFASLRFGESKEWLNNVFFKQYSGLTIKDFEVREIEAFAFSEKFAPLAKDFIEKKYHNLSHLKELGVIFVVPTASLAGQGQLMKVFSLAFHYFYEVQFYADLFAEYSPDKDFVQKLVSLLRGDVPEPIIDLSSSAWLVIQRYLEKEDANALSLMVPHINPESIHWTKAQNKIAKINPELEFWHNLDWVGDYFKDDAGAEVFVTFNLVDIAMILADKAKGKKYTYHQREAMWNRIFQGYFGWELLEKYAKDNIITGKIEFK